MTDKIKVTPVLVGSSTGCRWKPHPGPQEEFFTGPDVAYDVPYLGSGLSDGLSYSSLAPSPNPGWTYCPGSLTKKGNPK